MYSIGKILASFRHVILQLPYLNIYVDCSIHMIPSTDKDDEFGHLWKLILIHS